MPEVSPHDPKWTEFVARQSPANIFHSSLWMDLLSSCYGYRPFVYVVTGGDGSVTAGLPFLGVSSWLTGRRWVSLPFTDHCSPLGQDEEALKELIKELVQLRARQEIPRMDLHWPLPEQDGVHPGKEFVWHNLALSNTPEALFRSFGKMHQRNIRKAERAGVTVRQSSASEDLETYYRLHGQTRQRQGLPVQPRKFFRLLGEKILQADQGFVLLAHKDQVPIAGAVFLTAGETILYKYGASDSQYLSLRPNNLIFWKAIEGACQKGYRTFDFGKTDLDNEGLRAFKRGWGAEERSLRYTVISASQEPPAPPRERKARALKQQIYALMETVIRKAPPLVCRVMGELFYKHFP